MSVTVPVAFVQQFSANVHMLAEQKFSRLRQICTTEPITGESKAFERLGSVDAQVVTDRHGDTPLNNTPHTRRWLYTKTYDVADLIDKPDQVQLLIDLESRYTQRHASAMGRALDTEIVDALGRSVAEGHAGGTITAFPGAQQIVSGSVGLTVNKLIEAKRMLDAAEVDEMDRWFLVTSTQLAQLLADERVTSADFNTVKALVTGAVDSYMGFKFIRSERLALVSAERICYAVARGAMMLGVAQEPNSVSAPRPDKRMSTQIYTWGQWGAARLEDVRLVQVACA